VDDFVGQVIPGRLAFGGRDAGRCGGGLEGRLQCSLIRGRGRDDGIRFVDHFGRQIVPGRFAFCIDHADGRGGGIESGFQCGVVHGRGSGNGLGFVDHFGRQVIPGRLAFGDRFDRRTWPGAGGRQHGRRRDNCVAQQFVQVVVEDAGAVHAACSKARASSPRIQFKARR